MRTCIFCLALGFCLSGGALTSNAATITAKLIDSTPNAGGGIHSIQVWMKSDAPLGLSGAEFDIISAGPGNVQFPGGSSNTIFATNIVDLGYNAIKATALDAIGGTDGNVPNAQGQPMPIPGISDGDLDAIAGSVIAPIGNIDPAQGALLQSGNFELIATEKWTVTNSDFLNLYLTAPFYFTNSRPFVAAYDNVLTSGVAIIVPEPFTLALLTLGAFGLLALRRRRFFAFNC